MSDVDIALLGHHGNSSSSSSQASAAILACLLLTKSVRFLTSIKYILKPSITGT